MVVKMATLTDRVKTTQGGTMSELSKIFHRAKFPCSSQFLKTPPGDNTLIISLQEGPINENGVNVCQIDNAIWAIATILRSFNSRFPCRENSCAITHLDEAMMWLEKRTKDRTERAIEGTDHK